MRDITKISVQELALLIRAARLDVSLNLLNGTSEANCLRAYMEEWVKELPLHRPAFLGKNLDWENFQYSFYL